MFDLYGNQKLVEWKRFRDSLEQSQQPFDDLAEFWSHAPFVGSYLNPFNPKKWPDPWHLILDGKFDDLAITLGMLYTVKLTERFRDSKCDIHYFSHPEKKFPLVINDLYVLNWNYGFLTMAEDVELDKSTVIWSKHDQV